MAEALVSELEAAVADVGALLVRARKYRRGSGPEGDALAREAAALGDHARRLHRRGTLDADAAQALLDGARALAARIRALVQSVHDAPEYARAVIAHRTGDQAALAATLPGIFAGLEPGAAPEAVFHPLAWRRRGRPRPPAELAAELERTAAEGIPAEGDDLSPGVDPLLPAVTLLGAPPGDEPLAVRLPAAALGVPIYQLADVGDYVVYVSRLRAPFRVVLRTALEADDAEGIADFDAYRAAVSAALVAAGLPVDPV